MPEQENILFHTALFKQVSPEQAGELIEYLNQGVYNRGDVIFRQGSTDHRMYLLESGRVKLIRESADHRVQLLSIHAPGEMLGEVFCLVFHIGQRYGICGKCGNKTPADDGISAKK